MKLLNSGYSANICQNETQNQEDLNQLIASIDRELLPNLQLRSIYAHNPVVVDRVVQPWQLLGTGNYAAVFYHATYPNLVVKIYAPGKEG